MGWEKVKEGKDVGEIGKGEGGCESETYSATKAQSRQ